VLQIRAEGTINGVACLKPDAWNDLEVRWETDSAKFRVGNEPWHDLRLVFPTRNGISYLHLQSEAPGPDPHGVFLESVAASAL